ncbi:hypothetical protein KM043_008565 [Ampulex compressa]|nr:hypothetical protein KM043_008565 [Ampulex compressa]
MDGNPIEPSRFEFQFHPQWIFPHNKYIIQLSINTSLRKERSTYKTSLESILSIDIQNQRNGWPTSRRALVKNRGRLRDNIRDSCSAFPGFVVSVALARSLGTLWRRTVGKREEDRGAEGTENDGEGEVSETVSHRARVRSMENTNRPPHTYTTRNENIPASFGLLSAIKRIPPAQPRINLVPGPKQSQIRPLLPLLEASLAKVIFFGSSEGRNAPRVSRSLVILLVESGMQDYRCFCDCITDTDSTGLDGKRGRWRDCLGKDLDDVTKMKWTSEG